MSLFDFLFGCKHQRTSFPQTRRNKRRQGAYVVCLDCGTEFPYDMETMRIDQRLQAVSRKPEQKPAQVINIAEPRKVRVK